MPAAAQQHSSRVLCSDSQLGNGCAEPHLHVGLVADEQVTGTRRLLHSSIPPGCSVVTVSWAMAVQSLTCTLGWSQMSRSPGRAGCCTAAGKGVCCCKVANYLHAEKQKGPCQQVCGVVQGCC